MLRAGERAIFAVDQGLHLFDEEFCVAIGAATAEFRHVSGSIFANARFRVVHADDDERSDRARLNAMIGGLANVPVLAGNEGSGAIEKIDRKSTRLNSSHSQISYAVFCLKKKKTR